jgi:hypothetical protein
MTSIAIITITTSLSCASILLSFEIYPPLLVIK